MLKLKTKLYYWQAIHRIDKPRFLCVQKCSRMASSVVDKKLVRSKSGLRIVSESHQCPFELCEPPWIPDNECSQCMCCYARFDFMKRRHHCRRCGRLLCSSCCSDKIALPRMNFVDPVRLCSSCCEITRKENDFYDKHLKTLTNGANFTVSNKPNSLDNNDTFLCKLSPDHRRIVFEGNNSEDSFEPLDISTIQNVKVIKTPEEPQDFIEDCETDNSVTSGIHIHYNGGNNELFEMKLTFNAMTSNRIQSVSWIAALVKAVKMMFEAKRPRNF